MKQASRWVLRIHGTLMIVVCVALVFVGWQGYHTGAGIMAALKTQEIGYIGLFQAYLLLALVMVAMWVGSFGEETRYLHLLGFGAHVPPLLAFVFFWDALGRYNIPYYSLYLHLGMMTVEMAMFVLLSRQQTQRTLQYA